MCSEEQQGPRSGQRGGKCPAKEQQGSGAQTRGRRRSAEAPRRSSEAQGHTDTGQEETSLPEAPRRSSKLRGTGPGREGGAGREGGPCCRSIFNDRAEMALCIVLRTLRPASRCSANICEACNEELAAWRSVAVKPTEVNTPSAKGSEE